MKEVQYLLVLGWQKKGNKRTHVLSWGVGVPTWFSIVRAAICMGWPAGRQLQCPYAKGSATELAEKQRTAVIKILSGFGVIFKEWRRCNISWFCGDFTEWRISGTQTVPIDQGGSTQLTNWVSQCLQHQMLLMLWYHHLQHQMLLMVYELHQHQKRRLQLSLQEPFWQ